MMAFTMRVVTAVALEEASRRLASVASLMFMEANADGGTSSTVVKPCKTCTPGHPQFATSCLYILLLNDHSTVCICYM